MADNKISLEIAVDGNAEVQFKKIGDAAASFEAKANKSIFSFSRAWETAVGLLEGAAIIETFKAVGEAVKAFAEELIVESVKAAEEAQVAQNNLNTALALAGVYSKEASDQFTKYANNIQKTTTVEDDAAKSTAALIESLAQLDEKGLEKATTAALDMSAALGISTVTAAQLLGKAAQGQIDTMTRYGLVIEKGSTKAETFANVLSVVQSKFGGAAAAQLNTYSGATAQLANTYNDFQEEVGNVVVKNNAFIEVIKAASGILAGFNDELGGGAKGARVFAGETLVSMIDGLDKVATALDYVERIGTVAFYSIKGAADVMALGIDTLINGPLALLYKGLSYLPGVGEQFGKAFDDIMAAAAESANEVNKDADKINQAINAPNESTQKFHDVLLKLKDAAKKGLGEVKNGADGSVEPLNGAKKATEELTDAQIKLGEEGQKVADRFAEQDPAVKYQKDLAALEEAHKQGLALSVDYNTALDDIQKERDDALEAKRSKDIQDLKDKNAAMLALDKDFYAKDITENQKKITDLEKQEDKHSKEYLQMKKKEADQEFQIKQNSAHAISGILGNMATVAKAFGAQGFETFKALAEAQALVDTYASANAAFKSAAEVPIIGPVLAPIAAAAAVAAGLANVAQINAQHLATGIDEVPGIGSKDNYPAVLAPGERVVPRETNKDLKSFLAGHGPMIALLSSINEKLSNQQPVVVTLDGREIFSSMRQQLQGGRAFA